MKTISGSRGGLGRIGTISLTLGGGARLIPAAAHPPSEGEERGEWPVIARIIDHGAHDAGGREDEIQVAHQHDAPYANVG